MSPVPEKRDETPRLDDEELDVVEVITADEDGSGDDDHDEQVGYQLLAQEPDQPNLEHINDASATAASNVDAIDSLIHQLIDNDCPMHSNNDIFTTTNPANEDVERSQIWNLESRSIEPIGAETEDVIKSAMASFALPDNYVPEWAKVIPEEEWKSQLLTKIRDRKAAKQ